ncbi:ABC transporter permease [Lottiidibacillus patelloidae]|uniref:ABC transporter permease n=1 Tax=Lottiidibacillus patelloidae TaxID=2670334 RepID=UPI001E4299F5|nr:ABC transporter permease subunit [Lottiidibacillus patelloidae]
MQGLVQSFGYLPVLGQKTLSIQTYQSLFKSSDFWQSIVLTFKIAFLSSLLAGVIGLFISLCLFLLMENNKKGKLLSLSESIFKLPLLIPHIVAAYLMVLLFMQSGWISSIAAAIGIIDQAAEFPILINETFGWGIIITYAWKEAPFVSLMLVPILARLHQSWRDVSKVFGATTYIYLKEIVIPLLLPTWIAATFIVFAFTFSSFEIPYLLGVTYPVTLPVYAFTVFTSGGLEGRPEALAVNVILVLVTALLGLLAYKLSKRWNIGERERW